MAAAAALAEKEEVDSRSIFVGNVRLRVPYPLKFFSLLC